MNKNAPLRFLFVTPGYHPDIPGGAWRVAQELATRLAGNGNEVHVVATSALPDGDDLEWRDGVCLHWIHHRSSVRGFPARSGRNRAALRVCEDLMSSGGERFTVGVHHAYYEPAMARLRHSWTAVFHGSWAAEFRSQRAQGNGTLKRIFSGFLERKMHQSEMRLLKGARRIVVLSRHSADWLRNAHPNLQTPVAEIPGGVDLEKFRPASERVAIRRSLGIGESDILLLAVRRLDPRMGLSLLIKAFARLCNQDKRLRLRLGIIGDGPVRGELQRLAADLGLSEKCLFPGKVSEEKLVDYYCAADLVLMPSLELEGFGLATAEALACGTPVIGSLSGATPELLEPLSKRLVFESGSEAALEARIRDWLEHPEQFPTREDCRGYACRRFSWEGWVSQWEEWGREAAGR